VNHVFDGFVNITLRWLHSIAEGVIVNRNSYYFWHCQHIFGAKKYWKYLLCILSFL